MTPQDPIEEIRKRAEAATEGPWVFDADNNGREFEAGYGLYSEPDPKSILARKTVSHVRFGQEADAEFIAHARQDIPLLLARISLLEAVAKAARGLVKESRRWEKECDKRGDELLSWPYAISEAEKALAALDREAERE